MKPFIKTDEIIGGVELATINKNLEEEIHKGNINYFYRSYVNSINKKVNLTDNVFKLWEEVNVYNK